MRVFFTIVPKSTSTMDTMEWKDGEKETQQGMCAVSPPPPPPPRR